MRVPRGTRTVPYGTYILTMYMRHVTCTLVVLGLVGGFAALRWVSSTWLLSVLARILCCATWLVPCAHRRSAEIRLAGLIRLTFFLWRLSSAVAASALWLQALQPSACLLGASSLARPLWPLPTQAAPPPYRPWLRGLREKSNPERKPSSRQTACKGVVDY